MKDALKGEKSVTVEVENAIIKSSINIKAESTLNVCDIV